VDTPPKYINVVVISQLNTGSVIFIKGITSQIGLSDGGNPLLTVVLT
jgi:hypothetical protein